MRVNDEAESGHDWMRRYMRTAAIADVNIAIDDAIEDGTVETVTEWLTSATKDSSPERKIIANIGTRYQIPTSDLWAAVWRNWVGE